MPVGYGAEGLEVFEVSKDDRRIVMGECKSKRIAKRVANALVTYLAGLDNDRSTVTHSIVGFSVYGADCLIHCRTAAAAATICRAMNVYRHKPHRKEKT